VIANVRRISDRDQGLTLVEKPLRVGAPAAADLAIGSKVLVREREHLAGPGLVDDKLAD